MPEADGCARILVVDDEKNIRLSIALALEQEGFTVVGAQDAAAALRILRSRVVDCMIVDIQLGEVDGISLFRKARSEGYDAPTIFISGHATMAKAAEAVKLGGFDFLEKPFSAEKLTVTVERCLEMAAVKSRLSLIEQRADPLEIVGDSVAIRQLIREARQVASTSAGVHITGESGTGKELLASVIHSRSARRDGPFVKVNCSAIPDEKVESELFGHDLGISAGVMEGKKGLFELANRGTIFLDKVTDLSLQAQEKLLRVLQSGAIRKVGSEKVVQVDVRILSGSTRDLNQAVAESDFLQDLLFQLNVVPINLPPLRERPEDIPLLVAVLTRRISAKHNLKVPEIDDEVLLELKRYAWPGNVRELQNLLERMLIMGGARITIHDLPEEFVAADEALASRASPSLKAFRDNAEREHIIAALRRNGGNISQTAIELGVRRTYLHRRLAVLKIAKQDSW